MVSPSVPSWFPMVSGLRSAKAIKASVTRILGGDAWNILVSSAWVGICSFSVVGVALGLLTTIFRIMVMLL